MITHPELDFAWQPVALISGARLRSGESVCNSGSTVTIEDSIPNHSCQNAVHVCLVGWSDGLSRARHQLAIPEEVIAPPAAGECPVRVGLGNVGMYPGRKKLAISAAAP